MSSIQDKIRKFETDPDSFDELVAEFLISEKEEQAQELYELIIGSKILRARFESLTKIHRGVERIHHPISITSNKSAKYKTILYSAAAILLFSLGAYFYSANLFSPSPWESVKTLSFGDCKEEFHSEVRSLRSGSHSLCEFYFHSEEKGKKFKLRLLPNSNVSVSRMSDAWEISFRSGEILIDSQFSSFLFGKYPKDVHLNVYGHQIKFLGTRVRVYSSENSEVKVEVLEGKLQLESEKNVPEIPIAQGEKALIFLNAPTLVQKLKEEEEKDLVRAFSTVSVESEQKEGSKKEIPSPAKILYPEATEIPGNRIILKNGTIKKGTSLLQKGDIYILIQGDDMQEFKASEIKRIEFE
ncbi:hypothetical protein EHQ53_13850 [Leptospira langatensis]|uniref:Iron dicitrate transport regulator FecR n=1 Tax=Leptospira langatensis TaxID=2484983 RepID=A0A5F1ZRF2_9LEPT|nr:hypothetical protein [Leptospira langatensis]TGK02554.1 hypothetical protein EHO57_04265 [Leptospira langatensis]TGL40245.1 hypothetical protein EHQ53_13850 [Leptospira langatensis]